VKLVLAIMPDPHAGKIIDALMQRGFRATRFQSRGGFLRARNSTLLVGVDEAQLAEALDVIRRHGSGTRPAASPSPGGESGSESVSGVTVFVLDVVHSERV
jgi:uncharacterized protein YaaQ